MANYNQYPGGVNGTGGQDPYNVMRQRASQRQDSQNSENFQAMQRRQASLGGLGSGEYQKQAELQQQQQGQQRLDTQQGIDAAQTQEANEKNFSSDQLQKQQDFQGAQADKERALKEAGMAQQAGQFNQSLANESKRLQLEEQAQKINQQMNEWSQRHSGGLLGGGGFLGSGIGA